MTGFYAWLFVYFLLISAVRYHKVKQSCLDDGQGFVLAINYW